MSFGGFKFGSSSTSAPAAGQPAASVPSFSLTGPSPAGTPSGQQPASQPFSFGSSGSGAGAAAPPSTAQGTGGGLFGSGTQNQAQGTGQQTGGGGGSLFGNFGVAKPAAPAPSSGLFGSTTTGAQAQPQQPQTGGLFGGQQQQQQSTTAGQRSTSGLFGSQPQQQSTGLFGSTPQQPQQQQQTAPTSLFGSTNQQPQQQAGGLFGAQAQLQNKPVQGLQLAGSTSGNNNAGSTSAGGLTKATKFTDLPEQHQKMVEQLDTAFRQQRQLVYSTLDQQQDLGSAIRQVIVDVKSAEAECTALELGLAPLRRACEGLAAKVRSEEEDLQRLADIWGSYRPMDGRPSSLRAGALRDFRKQYFRKVVADSEERIPRYKKTIQELRRAVDSLQHANEVPSAQAIAQTIQNHQNAIYTLAAQVEGLEVRWNDVRSFYSQMYKDKTGSIRDPIDVARERSGLPPVRT